MILGLWQLITPHPGTLLIAHRRWNGSRKPKVPGTTQSRATTTNSTAMSSKHQILADGTTFGPYSGGVDDLGAVVAEIGSYTARMGYAGEDAPRSIFRTSVAALRGEASMNAAEAEGGGGSGSGSGSISRKSPAKSKGRGRGAGTGSSSGAGGAGGAGGGGGGVVAGSPLGSGPRRILKTHHGDWWHRTLERDGTDGNWEVASPLDSATGLLYKSPADARELVVPGPSSGQGTSDGHADGGSAMEIDGDDDNSSSATAGRPQLSAAALDAYGNEPYELLGRYVQHGFASAMPTSVTEQPFVLIEKSYNPPPLRQKSLEVLFEELDVPAAFLARDAVLACYAVGRSTGTVVDVGHSGTVVTPVYDGYVENRGILRSPVGGQMVDQLTLELLDNLYRTKRSKMKAAATPNVPPYVMPLYQVRSRKARGVGAGLCRRSDAMHREARMYVARTAKEFGIAAAVGGFGYGLPEGLEEGGTAAAAAVAPGGLQGPGEDVARIRAQYANAPKAPFDLPDGTVVDVPVLDRFDAAEIMFGRDSTSTKRREEATEKVRKKLEEVLKSSEELANREDGDEEDDHGGEDMGSLSASGLRCVKTKDAAAKSRGRRQPYARIVRRSAPYLSGQIGELTSASLPNMVCDAAFKCDRDQQAQLLGNVVLAGGGACLGPNDSSYPDRLRDEVEAIIHTHTPGWRVKVLGPDRRERSYCSWLGGSIMASIGMFHDFWITRKEYDEYGPGIVNRKCP